MRLKMFGAALAALILTAVTGCQAPASDTVNNNGAAGGTYTVIGQVNGRFVDELGNGVAGVTVVYDAPEASISRAITKVTSDADGYFRVTNLHSGTYYFRALPPASATGTFANMAATFNASIAQATASLANYSQVVNQGAIVLPRLLGKVSGKVYTQAVANSSPLNAVPGGTTLTIDLSAGNLLYPTYNAATKAVGTTPFFTTKVSDGSGSFTFDGLPLQNYASTPVIVGLSTGNQLSTSGITYVAFNLPSMNLGYAGTTPVVTISDPLVATTFAMANLKLVSNSTVGADGGTGNFTATNPIVLTFNNPLSLTIPSNGPLFDASGNPVLANLVNTASGLTVPASVSVSGNVLTLTPAAPLAAGITYTVNYRLTDGRTTSTSSPLAGNPSFTTAGVFGTLALVSNSTRDAFGNASAVPAGATPIVLGFNNALSSSVPMVGTLYDAAGTPVLANLVLGSIRVPATVAVSGNTLTLTPSQALTAGLTYNVNYAVTDGQSRFSSGPLTGTATFTVAGTTPTLAYVTNSTLDQFGNSAAVAPSAAIKVYFSNTLSSTVPALNTLYDTTGTAVLATLSLPSGQRVPASVALSGNSLTLTPAQALVPGFSYILSYAVTDGVTRFANNPVAGSLSFTVSGATPSLAYIHSSVLDAYGNPNAVSPSSQIKLYFNNTLATTVSPKVISDRGGDWTDANGAPAFAVLSSNSNNSRKVPAYVTVSGNTLTVTPVSALAPGAVYTLQYGVHDNLTKMADGYLYGSLPFITSGGTAGNGFLSVWGSNLLDATGQTNNVSISSPVKLYFSNPLVNALPVSPLTDAAGSEVLATLRDNSAGAMVTAAVSVAGSTLTLTPAQPLVPGHAYVVTYRVYDNLSYTPASSLSGTYQFTTTPSATAPVAVTDLAVDLALSSGKFNASASSQPVPVVFTYNKDYSYSVATQVTSAAGSVGAWSNSGTIFPSTVIGGRAYVNVTVPAFQSGGSVKLQLIQTVTALGTWAPTSSSNVLTFTDQVAPSVYRINSNAGATAVVGGNAVSGIPVGSADNTAGTAAKVIQFAVDLGGSELVSAPTAAFGTALGTPSDASLTVSHVPGSSQATVYLTVQPGKAVTANTVVVTLKDAAGNQLSLGTPAAPVTFSVALP